MRVRRTKYESEDIWCPEGVFGGDGYHLRSLIDPRRKVIEASDHILDCFLHMSKYFTYIARCSDDTLYTGYCVDLEAREAKHNSGEGAKYTRHRTPVKMVYHEVFSTRSDAMRREYEIKTWTRQKKEKLIETSRTP